jgi:5-methylcytosine-specific restriction enzyme subunit McrC
MKTVPSSLGDLLILQLLAEARDLVAHGLHREYVRYRRDLPSPRGRIDFARMARKGGLLNAAIPSRFNRRSDNTALNKALLAGMRMAADVAVDRTLKANARRIVADLENSVSAPVLSHQIVSLAKTAKDRRTARYSAALALIELLLDGSAISISKSDGTSERVTIPGFALDMNRLWQRLMSRVLKSWGADFEVREEYVLRRLIRRTPGYVPRNRRLPAPRPDFAVFRDGRLVAYLDAKYRDLWELSLPREMFYQVALYASAQPSGTAAAMLYPTDTIAASEERLEIVDPVSASVRGVVALRPVLLPELEELVTLPAGPNRDKRRANFAGQMLGAGGALLNSV